MVREQYENSWKDYYEILQVHPQADTDVIAAAYRRLALKYHPDRNREPEAERKFKEINEANEVLSDQERRARYDFHYQMRQNGQTSKDYYDTGASYQQSEYYQTYDEPSYSEDSWWREDEPASPPQDPYRGHDSYPYEPRPESILSVAFAKFLISRLVDRLAPNPDESQRILPWPSWRWQRVWLMGSLPLSVLLILIFAQFGWGAFVFAAVLASASLYAGITTRWLRATREAPTFARFAGGASIAVSSLSWTLGIIYAVIAIVFMVVVLFFMGVMLRAMLESMLDKRR